MSARDDADVGDLARPDPELLPRRQRARYDKLVDAALELLQQSEYERIKVQEVAEAANMALATVYRYFSSKEHLYAAVLLEWAKSFRPPGAGRAAKAPEAEQLSALMQRAIRAFERKPQMLRAEIALESTTDPNARAIFHKFGFQNYNALAGAMPRRERGETDAIVETVNCVLAMQLRYWAMGLCSIEQVYAGVQRSIDLIFAPERMAARAGTAAG